MQSTIKSNPLINKTFTGEEIMDKLKDRSNNENCEDLQVQKNYSELCSTTRIPINNDEYLRNKSFEWFQEGLSIDEVQSRIEVIYEEAMMKMVEDIEDANKQREEALKEAAEMDGLYEVGGSLSPFEDYDVVDKYFLENSNHPRAVVYRNREVWRA